MQRKLNIYQIFLAVLSIVVFNSCDKSDELNVTSADFKLLTKAVYLNEIFTLEAIDTLGNANYNWNFGDGTSSKEGYRVSHKYIEPGNYTASLRINGLNYSKTIRVLPGRYSYQIKNNSNYELNALIYINNYEAGDVTRLYVNKTSETDTIYVKSFMNEENLFGISLFVENSEYTLAKVLFLKEFQHRAITITDSTRLIPRMSHGVSPVVLLKDLYKF